MSRATPFVFVIAAALTAGATVHAQQVELEYSTIYGVKSQIVINRVPIAVPGGKVIYKDVTINLRSDTKGNLTYLQTKPIQSLSPLPPNPNLVPGIYVDSGSPSYGLPFGDPT